jgi:regulation of enolase protein 1 (concanavalin A-like superfamily)
MRVLIGLMVLAGSATASARTLTGNELVLLRMILRQEMSAEVRAAVDSGDPSARNRVAPLETALLGIPRVHDLYAIMTDKTRDAFTQFNAARALAYFGDTRCTAFLSDVLRAQLRALTMGAERSQAGLCLLYLGFDDFPEGFAFSRLKPPVYPELDAFLDEPAEPVSHSSPYTREQLETAIALYLVSGYPVKVRGPLSILTVEQEALAAVLREVAEHDRAGIMRVPFGNQVYEWEEFKDQILAGDLLYYFRSDDAGWEAQEGSEGYALIREGQVIGVILTGTNRSQGAGLLAFDDFNGPLGFGWQILNPDPSHWSLARVPGTLTITTQGGTFFRERQDHRNVFLVNCPAAAGQDFQVTTCLISFEPIGLWNQAGLLLWNSSDHYFKLVYEYGEGPPRPGMYSQRIYTASVEIAGTASFTWYRAEQYLERVWLRIAKRGPYCELYTSTDGETFTPLAALAPEYGPPDHRVFWGNAEVTYIGLFADNGGPADVPSVDASFDFFEVTAVGAADE